MSEKIDPTQYVYQPGQIQIDDVDLDAETVIMDGRRYTEADATRDAEAIEARHRGLRRGGKSMSADGQHSPTVSVVLPRDLHDRLREQASAEGVSMSKWLRRLVEERLAS